MLFRYLAGSLLAGLAAAQVSTDCQPLNTTDCPANPAFGDDYTFTFNSTPSSTFWETTAGTVQYSADAGAKFTINKQRDSPTIRSTFYIFFGRAELWIKAASGTGIISSVMFLSDDLDEIDWEFMGGNTTYVQTNYFGKGRQDYQNAVYHPVTNGILDDYHNYTTDWTSSSLDFYVNGVKVRTLLPADANSTHNYPQTPSRISMGIWAGGDPSLPKGTREWAGGDTDYTKGPFDMYVKSIRVTDYSSGKEYSYGDMSGSHESIKIAAGNSTIRDALYAKASSSESIADKWNNMSSTAKTAIYASGAGVGALIVAVGLYYCIRQRRIGAKENQMYEERLAQERLELEQLRKDGIDPDGLTASGSEYNARNMNKDGLSSGNAYNIPPGTPDSVAEEKAAAAAAAAGAAGGIAMSGAAMSGAHGYNNVPLNSPTSPNSPHLQQQYLQQQQQFQQARNMSPGPNSPASPSFNSFSQQNHANAFSHSGTQSPAFAAPTPQRSFTGQSLRNITTSPAGSGYHSPAPNAYTSPPPTYSSPQTGHASPAYNGYSNMGNMGNMGNGQYGNGQNNHYGAPGANQGNGFNNNSWQ